jgi:outer membrane protein OmpA-like peptidoglycan-associated protein
MNTRFLCALLLLGVGVSLPGLAQKPKDFGIKSRKALNYYLDGQEAARRRMRDQAIQLFEEAVKLEPSFGRAHYELGVNAFVQRDFAKALPHLQQSASNNQGELDNLPYFLGVSYFSVAAYDSARARLLQFLEAGVGRRTDLNLAAILLRHADFAREAIHDTVAFQPRNLGPAVNSPRDEYLPYLTADNQELIFTSRRPGNIGGYSSMLRDYSEDFYYSQWQDTGWSQASNFGPPINTPENEGSATMSEDGRTIYFTACNLEGGYGSCDIYQASREGNRWSRPQLLAEPVNSQYWDGQPCLSPDGQSLYFASDRPGGVGSYDIWVCTRQGSRWGEAVPLDTTINTVGHEDSPFLHADGVTLYFSSDFHPGFGSEDLFVSYRQAEGGWSAPKNLGYPLNTVSNESNLFVSANGLMGFINSDREGGLGGSDLYRFELAESIRPQRATFLRGTVLDSVSREVVAASIQLVDVESGDTIRQAASDPGDGRFLMSLPLEREYAAFVEAPGYLFASKNFFLKDLSEATYFDLVIELSPIRKGITVELKNIFFDFGKYTLQDNSMPELAFLVNYLTQNPGLRIEIQGHTDDVGSEQDNLALSQNRAEAVRKYLLTQGVAATRIEAKGYGESQPVADNESEEGRARNRRTEFKVLEME